MKRKFNLARLGASMMLVLGTAPAWAADVQLNVTSDWGSGFQGEFVIINDETTVINGWQLEFTSEFSIDQACSLRALVRG